MAKVFGRLARERVEDAYSRYRTALNPPHIRQLRFDENCAWVAYFTLVLTAAVHFAPEATAAPITHAVLLVM